jgi:hypothetical protein
MVSKTEIVKKITVKAVSGGLEKPEKPTPIMTVYGLLTDSKPDHSDYGDYIRFSGNFEAVNMSNGEHFRSGRLILPGIAEGLLQGALEQEGVESVQFALEIGIKPSKSPVGYDYTVKPLIETSENDPLADMRGKLSLPSPETVANNGESSDTSKEKTASGKK